MGKNDNNKANTDLWGQDLKKAREGLEEHVVSFTQLAERIAAETDNMAKELKKKALEQAKAEANEILAKAENQAQQIIEEKRLEARALANKETEVLKANTQKVRQLYIGLNLQLESLRQQLTVLGVDIEHTLSQLEKYTNPSVGKDESKITPDIESDVSPEAVDSISNPALEQIHPAEQLDATEVEKKAPVPAKNKETTDYEGDVELEILPPIDKGKVKEIMKYLSSMPEVEMTHHIPIDDKPLIAVFLREPMPLIKTLKTLPQVSQVWEVKNGRDKAIIGAGYAQGEVRRIQVSLWL